MFGSKKRTYVGTSLIRLIDEADIPDSVKKGIIYALHTDGDLLESVTDSLFKSIGIKAESFYKYGENHFIYGNPTGEFITDRVAYNQISSILRRETGHQNLQVVYAKFGPMNINHYISQILVDEYDYDTKTNKINVLNKASDIPAYLTSVDHYVPRGALLTGEIHSSVLDQWEPAWMYREQGIDNVGFIAPRDLGHDNPFFFTKDKDEVRVHYEIRSDALLPGLFAIPEFSERGLLTFDLERDTEADFFQAAYLVNGRRYYWSYQFGLGTYPELDGYFDNPENFKPFGEFYPSAYFRVNKKNLFEDEGSEEYKSNKKLLKILDIDYDFVAKAIKDEPDLKDVEYAYITFGVSPDSEDPVDREYLFNFFDKMYEYQDFSLPTPPAKGLGLGIRASHTLDGRVDLPNAVNIRDTKFRSTLGTQGIFKRIRAGTIGRVGEYSSYSEQVVYTVPGKNHETGEPEEHYQRSYKHVYMYQSGTGVYEEISVYDLQYKYFIYNSLGTLGADNNEFHIVPLERSIVNKLNIRKRERLMTRSLCMLFHSRVTIREKWYQSGLFQFVITAVSFAVGAYYFGPLLSGVNALVNAGFITTFQALVMVGKAIASGFLFSMTIKIAVDILGIDLSITLAVTLAAVAIYQGGFGNLTDISYLSAENLMKTALGFIDSIGESVQDALKIIGQEYTEFLSEAQEQLKLIEEANELLRPTSVLSPFVYLGESAEDFYNRTIHSGNVGVLAIEAQSNYFDRALSLPTFKDTLGGA